MAEQPTILDLWANATAFQTAGSPRARLEFAQVGDSIAHRVLLYSNGHWQSVLESVEFNTGDHFPVSPVFQQVHRSRVESDENRGDANMLIGSAGSCHWSACIVQDHVSQDASNEPQEDGAKLFTFDLACRCRNQPEWLGSTYRLSPEITIDRSHALRFGFRQCRPYVQLKPLSLTGSAEPSCQLKEDGKVVQLICNATRLTDAATYRWRYAIELVE
jgi:hypothetical protein